MILNGEIIDQKNANGECVENGERLRFIFVKDTCNNVDNECLSSSSASSFGAALLPSNKDVSADQLVCIEYKYYMVWFS